MATIPEHATAILDAKVAELRRRRMAVGMSMRKLSERTGVRLNTISKIERREQDPHMETYYLLLLTLRQEEHLQKRRERRNARRNQ